MNEPKPDLATHERLLKGVRQEVRNLQVMQMRAGQSAEQLRHLADLERSVGPGRGEAADQGARLCQKSGRRFIEPEANWSLSARGPLSSPEPVPKTPRKWRLRNPTTALFGSPKIGVANILVFRTPLTCQLA
jgi:hypothetical protein